MTFMLNMAQKKMQTGGNYSKFRELGMLLTIILVSVFVQLRNPNFLTLENINDMLTNTAILVFWQLE